MHRDEIFEKIIETNRDVKWIRAEIEGLKSGGKELEKRVAVLERQNPPAVPGALSDRQVSAGIGAGAGSVVAVILRLFSG